MHSKSPRGNRRKMLNHAPSLACDGSKEVDDGPPPPPGSCLMFPNAREHGGRFPWACEHSVPDAKIQGGPNDDQLKGGIERDIKNSS